MSYSTLPSIRRHIRAPLLGVFGFLLVPTGVSAQAAATTDSAPFRAGQYGVEFGIGGFTSLGVLRFSTPQRALLFDVDGFVRRSRVETANFPNDATTSYRVSARAGVRRYRPVTSTVQRFTTLGVFGRSERSTSFVATARGLPNMEPQTNTARVQSRGNTGGLFAELGAAWMVKPRLSLGAAWNAEARYSRFSTIPEPLIPGVSETRRSAWGFSIGTVSVRGNLYF